MGASEIQLFKAVVQREGKFIFVALPFSPREVWGSRPRYPVAGTINGSAVRGTLGAFKQVYFLRLSAAWRQKVGIEPGATVMVNLNLEERD